jgi:hypothetical protein
MHIPHFRKLFGSLAVDLLHSHMPEKFSGPWNGAFYIPPCYKSLAPGGRPFLAPGTRIFWHWGLGNEEGSPSGDRKTFLALRNEKGLFPWTFPAWAWEKKQQQGHHAATFIIQQCQQQKSQQPQKHYSKCMGASNSMSKDKSTDANNSRAMTIQETPAIAWMPATSWNRAGSRTPLTGGPTEETPAF